MLTSASFRNEDESTLWTSRGEPGNREKISDKKTDQDSDTRMEP